MEFKMYLSSKRLFSILFFISVILVILNFYWLTLAQSVEQNSQKEKRSTYTEKNTNTGSPSDSPAKDTPKERGEIDQLGEKVGQQIDDITQQASSRIGPWINAKVFSGITWFKLILCLFLLFVVLLIERIVRLTIDRKRKKAEEEGEKKIKHLFLEAVAKPLSLFIWVYGVYIVLTPLFVHFQKPDGAFEARGSEH
jgi:MscS family membrane protein